MKPAITTRSHSTRIVAAFVLLALLSTTAPVYADVTLTDLGTLGGNYSYADDVSNNGVVVGMASTAAGDEIAFRWENGVMTDLGTFGGNYGYAHAITPDGSVIVGDASLPSTYHAFRWESGVMTDLGALGTAWSVANGVSSDGNVIVGYSRAVSGEWRAFRWEGGVMSDLGTLGGNRSIASDVSANGSVVVGQSRIAGGANRAFRWEGGVMSNLGTLGGTQSAANGISGDGNVIVGSSSIASGDTRAFRWEGGVMTDLGTLGGNYTTAFKSSYDGSMIVGNSGVSSGDYHAVLWNNGALADLNDLAPDLTGWNYLESAYNISDNGNFVAGYGITDAGEYHAYLLNLAAAAAITPEQLAQDLAPAIVPASQSREALGGQIAGSLHVARNAALYFPSVSAPRSTATAASPADIEPAAGGADWYEPASEHRHAIYAIGSYGWGQGGNDFDSTSGSINTGILVKASDHLTFGAGVIGARSRLATPFDGESRVNAKGGTILGAYAPPSGLSFYASAAFAALDAETDRRYLSGGVADASSGKTEGTAFGVVARTGYTHNIAATTAIMPYAEAEVTHASLDGYTETGGAFPAVIDKQSGTTTVSRIGAELSHAPTPDLTLRARAAWGHRYGDPDEVSATAATLTVSLPTAAGDRDWAEAGVSASWRMRGDALLSADLSGRSGETETPAVSLTAAIIVPF